MAHYFLTQKLELLDQAGEWHFERDAGYLFVHADGAPPKQRFWGRVLDLAIHATDVSSGAPLHIEGLTFFASRVQVRNCPKMQLKANRFFYSSHSRRALGQLDAPESNLLEKVDNALIAANEFRYSEGKAIGFDGRNVRFTNNLAAWSGFNGIDGPATVKVNGGSQSTGTIVTHNSLRWCGTVSGFFNTAPGARFEANLVEKQNWGGLQHDGAGIHVTIGGQASLFTRNWVFDGVHSLMIRFDTAKSTTLAKVGRKGTVSYNVGWGGPALVIKGDDHTIEHNTVVGAMQIVVNFGAACGMNAKTKVAYNAEDLIESRGSCTGHNSLPAATKDNFPRTAGKVDDVCSHLVDCARRDFRPKPSATALQYAGGYIGAYDANKPLTIPGCQLAGCYVAGPGPNGKGGHGALARSPAPTPKPAVGHGASGGARRLAANSRCRGRSAKKSRAIKTLAACAAFAGKAAIVTYCGKQRLCAVETTDCSEKASKVGTRKQKGCDLYKLL